MVIESVMGGGPIELMSLAIQERHQLLSEMPLLKALTEAELGGISLGTVEKSFEKGQVVFREGDKADFIWFIIEGITKATLSTLDGHELVVGFSQPGMVLGELALLRGELSYTSVTVVKRCRLLGVPIGEFRKLVPKNPAFLEEYLSTVGQRIKALASLVVDISFQPASVRVVRRLVQIADTFRTDPDYRNEGVRIPFAQDEIAKFAGVSKETASRVLSTYRRKGWLSSEHGQLSIINLEQLRKV